jgi:7,8-dihydropterin-6-yl-methyl-4-(beta-D-ribofuranosyl)aminobenzene 5'-phosphate synthase
MRRIVWGVLVVTVVLALLAVVAFEIRHQRGNRRASEIIAEFEVVPVRDLGSTRTLRILPLIDYHTSDSKLRTEVGVSYLVETDDQRILFDLAQNSDFESPSPLEANMRTLGVDLATIDTIFISHNHLDHVGGMHWSARNTFSLGTEQRPFPNPKVRAIVPERMTYPGLSPIFATRPMRIGEGTATTGLIPRQLVIGWIEEHSLVVKVEGLGGVIIVGCGHQPVQNLVARFDEAFDFPLYGIVGGLHLPVPDGRINIGPVNLQRRFASGDGFFRPITMDEVEQVIQLLKSYDLGVVAVGGHDSSDAVIERMRDAFGAAHRYVRVGEEIVITAQ